MSHDMGTTAEINGMTARIRLVAECVRREDALKGRKVHGVHTRRNQVDDRRRQ